MRYKVLRRIRHRTRKIDWQPDATVTDEQIAAAGLDAVVMQRVGQLEPVKPRAKRGQAIPPQPKADFDG